MTSLTQAAAPGLTVDAQRGEGLIGASLNAAMVANAQILRVLYNRRIATLEGRLADEIAWKILLELVVAEVEGRAVNVTVLATQTQAPLTTTSRYLSLICASGLAMRMADRVDRRSHAVRLTTKGRNVMADLLKS
jgi:DNA-binding MarR family transcriptional regulator